MYNSISIGKQDCYNYKIKSRGKVSLKRKWIAGSWIFIFLKKEKKKHQV